MYIKCRGHTQREEEVKGLMCVDHCTEWVNVQMCRIKEVKALIPSSLETEEWGMGKKKKKSHYDLLSSFTVTMTSLLPRL